MPPTLRAGLSCGALATALLLVPAASGPASTGREVKLAVASNFIEPARELAARFEKATGNRVVVSPGATGGIYAQVTQGAPFDVFLSADTATPARAVAEGHAVAGTAFTYAVGRLVLYSATPGLIESEATLRSGKLQRIAIANPATAPYGAAAIEVMRSLGILDVLRPRLVQGASIAQAMKFVETGNAEAGFVALAQVARLDAGSRWVVPSGLHAPIRQNAVLLRAGADNAAARGFLAFLREPEARKVIGSFGYANE